MTFETSQRRVLKDQKPKGKIAKSLKWLLKEKNNKWLVTVKTVAPKHKETKSKIPIKSIFHIPESNPQNTGTRWLPRERTRIVWKKKD